MTYEDLDLRISSDGAGFVVSIDRNGQVAREPFEIDLNASWDIWEPEVRSPKEAQGMGALLFNALIGGTVRDVYQQARGRSAPGSGRGLRVRIQLDPKEARVRPLLRLPWEILFDPHDGPGRHLALDVCTPVVRAIDSTAEAIAPLPGALEQVLVARANPASTEVLDLDVEQRRIEKALADARVHPTVLPHASRHALFKAIRGRDFHIVHLMGHGQFDPGDEEGTILLETEQGGCDPISAGTLASCFNGKPAPRLVVLSACYSAEPGRGAGVGPFASMAAALVGAGLPAVLAMQAAIADASAICFTEWLYWRISCGDPVEAAVTDARLAVQAERPDTPQWAIPVLFVRGGPPQGMASAAHPAPLEASAPRSKSPQPSVVQTINNSSRIRNQVIAGPVEQQHNRFESRRRRHDKE